jgi:hypothetical protein
MKYSVEMGSDAMTYITSFIKTGSAIHNFKGWEYIDTSMVTS